MKKIWILGFALCAASAHALEGSNGQTYTATANDHGAAMKSAQETIYLGNSCDALSDKDETGTWAWANGGFVVAFPDRRIGFARQDHPVPGGDDCRM